CCLKAKRSDIFRQNARCLEAKRIDVLKQNAVMSLDKTQDVLKQNAVMRQVADPMSLERTWDRENVEEAFTIIHELPDQYVTIGTTLTTNCKQLLADVLRESGEDMYPLPEEGEELASLMGYPYKFFLRLSKEYSQIKMAEGDEEKTGFHTEEGVYCFTHMPKELKKLRCYTSEDDGKDVKETLRKLKRVNIKINLTMSSFRVTEGRFLGHMVAEEGLRADPGRIQAIILSPTPRSPNQIRSLFLQLTAISKFIPKLAELKHPIREARTRMEKAKESGWTNEAEETL
ncbi:hypothetical protein Tco_1446867, partial [Tanacetum coccineum]